MIDRERYVLIKSFTDTLLEYKDEIRTLKERCKSLEEQLNRKGENVLELERKMVNSFHGVTIEKDLKIKSLEERCKYLEEQLNRKG